MNGLQSSLASSGRPSGRTSTSAPLHTGLIAGFALATLGVALFGFGIFHAFQNGSCSTTGYSPHYGPVPTCGAGVGWWMLMILTGIALAVVGCFLTRALTTLIVPLIFVALGAPFIALALRSGTAHLVYGSSPSTGRLESGIFGGCFALAGLIWGACILPRALSGVDGRSRLAGVLASGAGIAVAFVITAGVTSAIGTSSATARPGAGNAPVVNVISRAATQQTNAAIRRANAAVKQATSQAATVTKLAACVSAARTNTARIQKCEAKYMP
jgi:hypothetical protein